MPGPGGLMLCDGYIAGPTMGSGPEAAHDMPKMGAAGMDMAGMDMSQHTNHPNQGSRSPHHEGMGVCSFAAAATGLAFSHAWLPSARLQIVSTTIAFPPEKLLPRGTIVPTRLPRGPPLPA